MQELIKVCTGSRGFRPVEINADTPNAGLVDLEWESDRARDDGHEFRPKANAIGCVNGLCRITGHLLMLCAVVHQ